MLGDLYSSMMNFKYSIITLVLILKKSIKGMVIQNSIFQYQTFIHSLYNIYVRIWGVKDLAGTNKFCSISAQVNDYYYYLILLLYYYLILLL
jgi:hypothetical protein